MRVEGLCPECRTKIRAYQRELYMTRQLRRGAVARYYTSSRPAARRVVELLAAGETYSSISAKSDCPRSSLCRIVSALRRRERSTMRSDVSERLLRL